MNYQSLIASIQAAIYNNGTELITGNVLQGVLLDMVNALDSAGATYGGTITSASAAPADLDQPTVYLALEAGTYTNYLDSGGNPIVTTGPALIIYNGGASLVFEKTDLPSGGSGATVITVSPGDSLIIRLPKAAEGIKGSYRIDMTAAVYGGDVDARYIGSLIIECNELAMQTAHGYYYGDDMDEILSEVAIWKDDPEFYPDEQDYYLLLTTDSNLNEVIFSISSLDGQSVDAVAGTEDENVKVADATITPVGSGGGDGKMGVISQTQTWSGSGSNPRTYVMSDQVTGLIPQANIDLFEAAGATFNATSGYFELNGLTDLSYEEMKVVYNFKGFADAGVSGGVSYRNIYPTPRTLTPIANKNAVSFINGFRVNTTGTEASDIEAIGIGTSQDARLYALSLEQIIYNCQKIRHVGVNGSLAPTASASLNLIAANAYSLETFRLVGLAKNITFPNSSLLSADSVAYMITNAGTATITITLHATAYARANADADVQAALAAHTNVSLQSA